LNKLLESLQQQGAATAFVFNPRLTASQFFDYMIADFGIVAKSRNQVLVKLHQWLLDRYQAGGRTVLVVDEAQNLSRQTLEEIRLLTNLETSTDKLLQIVLAGQPELDQKLNQRDLRQLRQRIALRVRTVPLTAEETSGYILERLRIAGSSGEEVFTPSAIEAVHRHAHGIPRVTNLLSDHAMLRAFFEQRKPVTAEIVDAVASDCSLDEDELPAPTVAPSRSTGKRRSRKQADGSRANRPPAAADQADAGQSDLDPAAGITQSKLPLFVYGYGPDGSPFYEQAHSIATNPRGGLISMQSPVLPGQRLLITNKENECSQECVVEFVGPRLSRGLDVAFEFSAPAPHFWEARQTEENKTSEGEGGTEGGNEGGTESGNNGGSNGASPQPAQQM